MRGSFQQQNGAGDPANEAGNQQRNHDARRDIKPAAISAAAGGNTNPKCERVGGVGRNWRHANEQQRWECDETPTPGYRVQGATQNSGQQQEDGFIRVQIEGVPQDGGGDEGTIARAREKAASQGRAWLACSMQNGFKRRGLLSVRAGLAVAASRSVVAGLLFGRETLTYFSAEILNLAADVLHFVG